MKSRTSNHGADRLKTTAEIEALRSEVESLKWERNIARYDVAALVKEFDPESFPGLAKSYHYGAAYRKVIHEKEFDPDPPSEATLINEDDERSNIIQFKLPETQSSKNHDN